MPAARNTQHLVRAHDRYERAGRNVRFLGILYQDTRAGAHRYLSEYPGDWTQLVDPGSRTAGEYGECGVPETYFSGAHGSVGYKHVGPVDDATLRPEIDRLLVEPDPQREGGRIGPP